MKVAVLSSSLALLAAFAAAQEPTSDVQLSSTEQQSLLDAFREIPIGQLAATEQGRSTTRYALREHYKVELSDSFLFVPALGAEAPENLPLRWTTQAIRRDGAPLAMDRAAATTHGAWNYEIHQPQFTERYDLRPAGLELSWQLTELPPGAGDLIVEGAIETSTHSPARGFEHAELSFSGVNGDVVLHFGAALAFDARGNQVAVPTSWDGEMARLRVPANWLATAQLPIVIDPLISGPDLYVASSPGALSSIDMQFVETAVTRKVFVAFTRAFSATDHDVYGALMHPNFTGITRVFVDITTQSSDQMVRVAFCNSPARFVVATQRDFTSPSGLFSGIRLYYHDRDSLVENSGLVQFVEGAPTISYSRPALGGSDPYYSPGGRVLLVYQADTTTTRANTLHSEIFAARIDVANRSILAPYRAGAYPVGLSYDRGHPTVSPIMGTSDGGWMIAFVEIDRSVTGDDWDVRGTLTDDYGNLWRTSLLADAGGTRHCVHPRIAGADGKYMLVYGSTPNLSEYGAVELRSQRIEWNGFQTSPNFTAPTRTIATAPSSELGLIPGKLEKDRFVANLWALTFLKGRDEAGVVRKDAYVYELGGTGGVVQGGFVYQTLGQDAVLPTLAFGFDTLGWIVLTGSATTFGNLVSANLTLDWLGAQTIHGGCGASQVVGGVSLAGNSEYFVELRTSPATPAVLIIGALPSLLPLDGLGMNGCVLGVDPSFWLATLSQVTDAQGIARQQLPLPDAPVFIGNFSMQWVYSSPNSNALGLQLSAAYEVRVR